MDVSTFRAGVRIARRGDAIASAAIAYAGVGPTARRLPRTEAFLAGRPFSEATFREAGRLARAEVEPISDVRGSRDFRLRLAENILLKFYHETIAGRRRDPAVNGRAASDPIAPGDPGRRAGARRRPIGRPVDSPRIGPAHVDRPGGLPRRHPARPRRTPGGVRRQPDGPCANRRDRRLRGGEGPGDRGHVHGGRRAR